MPAKNNTSFAKVAHVVFEIRTSPDLWGEIGCSITDFDPLKDSLWDFRSVRNIYFIWTGERHNNPKPSPEDQDRLQPHLVELQKSRNDIVIHLPIDLDRRGPRVRAM